MTPMNRSLCLRTARLLAPLAALHAADALRRPNSIVIVAVANRLSGSRLSDIKRKAAARSLQSHIWQRQGGVLIHIPGHPENRPFLATAAALESV